MVLVVGVLVEQGNNSNGIHDVELLNFGQTVKDAELLDSSRQSAATVLQVVVV